MYPWHQPRSSAEIDPGGPPGVSPEEQPAWKRPVRALLGTGVGEAGTVFPPSAPSLWSDLTDGQQHIASAILSHLALSPAAGAAMVDLQRERLRAGAMRRSDDIETLTALVGLLVGSPVITTTLVDDIHRAYQHLRQCHWWPSGPEDLPLAALLVAGAADADQQIARIEELHLALSEGDEVPGDVCALVALSGCVPDLFVAQVVMRLGALRTELLLSGLALQDDDIAALLTLATIPAGAEVVMQEFVAERKRRSPTPEAPMSGLAITMATDAVVLRHLDGVARRGYIASLAIRAWLVHRHHPQCPSTRFIRRSL